MFQYMYHPLILTKARSRSSTVPVCSGSLLSNNMLLHMNRFPCSLYSTRKKVHKKCCVLMHINFSSCSSLCDSCALFLITYPIKDNQSLQDSAVSILKLQSVLFSRAPWISSYHDSHVKGKTPIVLVSLNQNVIIHTLYATYIYKQPHK